MNTKYKSPLILLLVCGMVWSSCSKFGDINTNPNAIEKVNAPLLATNVILKNLKYQGRDAKAMIADNASAKYMGYMNEGMMSAQYALLGAADFGIMTMLPNLENMVIYATGTPMEDSYRGLAKFSSAYMFYNLTMQVGDIPYSAAGLGISGQTKAKYDTQEQVFLGILEDLKAADQYFAKGIKFDGDPSPYDGNPEKWRRAVNSFALKVLMSLSPKSANTVLNIKTRFAEIVNAGFILQNNTGYLGLNYSATNTHPVSGPTDLFTSKTIISSLLIDQLKMYNDRRLFYFADPSKAQLAANVAETNPAAYVGANVSDDYNELNTAYLANKFSLINSRYQKETASEPRMLVSYPEQQFILAEARILGWISTGSAQDYYESGVKAALANIMATKASYAHGMTITQSYIDNYFTGSTAFAASQQEQLKQIWWQRYILNFMQDPNTAYFEYRRTQFPQFPINPNSSLNVNNKAVLPVRWLYPASEANFNKDNLTEALTRQYGGVDEINNLMWLLK